MGGCSGGLQWEGAVGGCSGRVQREGAHWKCVDHNGKDQNN